MRIHPLLFLNDRGSVTLKNGQVVKPTSVTQHQKNLKASGFFQNMKDKLKKMDKKKFMDNVVRTHGTIRGLLGGRQKGSSRVALVSNLSSDRKEMARFAQAAYKQPQKVGAYTLDKAASNSDCSFYVGPGNKVVAAIAGTRPGVRDVKEDFQLAQNKKGNVKRINSVTSQIASYMKQHPQSKVTMSAHSLGGYVGHHAHDRLTSQGLGSRLGNMYSYNMGISPLGLSKSSNKEALNLQNILKGSKHRPTVIGNDAVSAGIQGFSHTKNLVTVDPIHKGVSGLARNHSIAHFVQK